MLVSVLALALVYFRGTPPEMPVLRTTILPSHDAAPDFTIGLSLPALSSDGKRIVSGAQSANGKAPCGPAP